MRQMAEISISHNLHKGVVNLPRVGAPVHGVDLGEMAAQSATGAHLNATHRLHVGSGLYQCGITCRLPCILNEDEDTIYVK